MSRSRRKSTLIKELFYSLYPLSHKIEQISVKMWTKPAIHWILLYNYTSNKIQRRQAVGRKQTNTAQSLHFELFWPWTNYLLERFSFECQKVIGFALSTLHDWLEIFAPLFHPIRSTTKTNRDAFACIFPHFTSATCNYFEFWLVHCFVCVLCDWLE